MDISMYCKGVIVVTNRRSFGISTWSIYSIMLGTATESERVHLLKWNIHIHICLDLYIVL